MSALEAQHPSHGSTAVLHTNRNAVSVDADESLRRRIATTLLPGFEGTILPEWLADRLRDGLGGVCVFGPNIVSLDQVRSLTDAIYAANPDAIIAIDEEGGDVTRLYYDTGSPYPGNAVLGRINDTKFTESIGLKVGWELRRAGCNVNFAPDVDINSNADNPVIGVRSFGASPEDVTAHSAAWTRGLQAAGVAVSAKHFPGHGDTAQDSHLATPVVDRSLEQLRERELRPFAAVIEAGARTIMTSHIVLPQIDPDNPATLSRAILHGLLREELGFEGVIVSDALDMKGASGEHGIPRAAVLSVAAGCDLLCLGTKNTDEQIEAIEQTMLEAVETGELDSERVSDAARRVETLSQQLAADREDIPIPDDGACRIDPEADRGVSRVVAAFDSQPNAAEWLRESTGDFTVVLIETESNIAVGVAPWGPQAVSAAHADSHLAERFDRHPRVTVTEATPNAQIDANSAVLVVGRDNHRHSFARAVIDDLRAKHPQILVVDMGWPSDDRRYADVATFGASRLVGGALMSYLGEPAS